jgi:exopolyphosphatase/guanosine-5'-triphosphate,3'-diphosphate pyrophosphatase
MKKFAALDLGSNSFLCLLGRGDSGRIQSIEKDLLELVRLGEGLTKNRRFSDSALLRAREALARFKKEIDVFEPEVLLAMATAAARDAENKIELEKLCDHFDLPLKIISGGEEARLTYQGALSDAQQDPGANETNKKNIVLDIGGRSTEIVVGRGVAFEKGTSISLGAVELTEAHNLNLSRSEGEILLARQDIQERIRKGLFEMNPLLSEQLTAELIAVAGTPTTLAQMFVGAYDRDKIDGFKITQEALRQKTNEISILGPEQISKQYQIPPQRSDVILAGALILDELMIFLKLDHMKVSTKGIRYGIAMELIK